MVKVHLRGTVGYGRPRIYYGPGVVEVPDGLARALGLKPLVEEVAAVEEEGGAPLEVGKQVGGFTDVPGSTPLLAPELVELLAGAGYNSPESVLVASDAELLAIPGIGPARLRQIREAYGR